MEEKLNYLIAIIQEQGNKITTMLSEIRTLKAQVSSLETKLNEKRK